MEQYGWFALYVWGPNSHYKQYPVANYLINLVIT